MSLIEREVSTRSTPDATNLSAELKPARQGFLDRWLPGPLKRLDRGILALIIVFILTLPLFTPRIYASDEIKYFSYLHSILFDHDVDFTNEYTYFYQLNPTKNANIKEGMLDKLNEKGIPVNEGPVGSALLWAPFYGVAHVVALGGDALGLKSFKPDGYSAPYIWAVTLGSLLYGFAGLILTYLFCTNFLPRYWSAFATVVIWLASPVLFYMSLTPPMSHANSLFMISLWLWLWYKTRGWRVDAQGNFSFGMRRGSMWLLLGVLGAVATMVREQDGTIMIVAAAEALYLYWHIWRQAPAEATLTARIKNWLPLFGRNVLLLVGFVLAIIPQFIVYTALNGHPGPSKVVGDKLQFLDPIVPLRMIALLFDPNHGMLWWAPVLLPALVGLGLMLRQKNLRLIALFLLLAFLVELYVSASFQTWTMQGSFGPRRLIGVSPVYIAGLGYLGWWLNERRRGWHLSRRWLVGLAAFLIFCNLSLIFQYSAIRTTADRLNLDPARVVADEFTKVPGKLIDTANNFLFHREKFYKP